MNQTKTFPATRNQRSRKPLAHNALLMVGKTVMEASLARIVHYEAKLVVANGSCAVSVDQSHPSVGR
jgi:hypothetical protein